MNEKHARYVIMTAMLGAEFVDPFDWIWLVYWEMNREMRRTERRHKRKRFRKYSRMITAA